MRRGFRFVDYNDRCGIQVGRHPCARARGTCPSAASKQLKGTRWQLLKSSWNLSLFDRKGSDPSAIG